ncbi:MAG: hypothetical protein V5B35_09545 [Candidatus Accumulibacter necessarius]|jgi:hypothetical protein
MTYATGVASTANQLIDAIHTFASANGWTVNAYAADGAGYRLHLNRGDVWADFSTAYTPGSDALALKGSTGYSGASAWDNQPNAIPYPLTCPNQVGTQSTSLFPCTWHLFAQTNPDLLAGVLVSPAQANTHFAVGQLIKIGIYDTGAFYGGHQFWAPAVSSYYAHNLALRAEVEGTQWLGAGSALALWRDGAPEMTNQFNGLAPLMPIRVMVQSAGYGVLLGFLPHLRCVHMQHFNNGDGFTIGADEWLVFFRSDRAAGGVGLALRK